jgi:hypothetical protein
MKKKSFSERVLKQKWFARIFIRGLIKLDNVQINLICLNREIDTLVNGMKVNLR